MPVIPPLGSLQQIAANPCRPVLRPCLKNLKAKGGFLGGCPPPTSSFVNPVKTENSDSLIALLKNFQWPPCLPHETYITSFPTHSFQSPQPGL